MNKASLYLFFTILLVLCNRTSLAQDTILLNNNDISWQDFYVAMEEFHPLVFQPYFFAKRNDTIFDVCVYYNSIDSTNIDSTVVKNIYLPYNNKWWITRYPDGEIRICKFRKMRHHSKEFISVNNYTCWGSEMELRDFDFYDTNGKLITKVRYFGTISTYHTY